jgi:hypothetical protein
MNILRERQSGFMSVCGSTRGGGGSWSGAAWFWTIEKLALQSRRAGDDGSKLPTDACDVQERAVVKRGSIRQVPEFEEREIKP